MHRPPPIGALRNRWAACASRQSLYDADWLSDYWLTAQVKDCPGKVVPSRTICTSKPFWLCWMVIFKALVGCHDILILGKSPIKWRQRPDMTLAVDWDVKHQFKQTNKQILFMQNNDYFSKAFHRASNDQKS